MGVASDYADVVRLRLALPMMAIRTKIRQSFENIFNKHSFDKPASFRLEQSAQERLSWHY
jgi:hypothetical protein